MAQTTTTWSRPRAGTASSTHHHPRKKLLNRLHAIITTPKRVLGSGQGKSPAGAFQYERGSGSAASASTSSSSAGGSDSGSVLEEDEDADDDDDDEEGIDNEAGVLGSPRRNGVPVQQLPVRARRKELDDGRAARRRGRSGTAVPMANSPVPNASTSPSPPKLFKSDSDYACQLRRSPQPGFQQTQQPLLTTSDQEDRPIIVRPHLKVRIVTWYAPCLTVHYAAQWLI